jgi:hypothetical protein
MKRIVVSALLLGCFGIALPSARADEWDKRTHVTISSPLEVPGVVLPPGQYVFKVVDLKSTRNIVQILNNREDRVYATVMTVPNERLQPTGQTVITMYEARNGSPEALRAWFYPGDNIGHEFLYPKDQANKLSASAQQNVPFLTPEDEKVLKNAGGANNSEVSKAVKTESAREPAQANAEPEGQPSGAQPQERGQAQRNEHGSRHAAVGAPPEPAPSRDERQVLAQAPPAPAPQNQQSTSDHNAPAQAASQLPHTASDLPLLVILGGISLAGALWARRLRV